MHETVFKNRFGNHACAFRHGQQSHELCLQIGWKARKRFGNDVFADKLFSGRVDQNSPLGGHDFHAHFLQNLHRCFKCIGLRVNQLDFSAGNCRGHGIGAGFDTVRNNLVPRAVQLFDALNRQNGSADARNLGAHVVQQVD